VLASNSRCPVGQDGGVDFRPIQSDRIFLHVLNLDGELYQFIRHLSRE
jgi:hypothetical protein